MKRGNQLDGIDLIFSFFFFSPPSISSLFLDEKEEGGRGNS